MPRQKSNDDRLEVRLPRNLSKEARRIAKQQKKSVSEIVRDFLVNLVTGGKQEGGSKPK